MTGYEPQWDNAHIRRLFLAPEAETTIIMPTGYLLALTVSSTPYTKGYEIMDGDSMEDAYLSAQWKVTNYKGALFGMINWPYAMSTAGIAFPEPLPNMNTADPYLVRAKGRQVEPVWLDVIGLWQKQN